MAGGRQQSPNRTGHRGGVIQVQVHSYTLSYMVQPERERGERVGERANRRKKESQPWHASTAWSLAWHMTCDGRNVHTSRQECSHVHSLAPACTSQQDHAVRNYKMSYVLIDLRLWHENDGGNSLQQPCDSVWVSKSWYWPCEGYLRLRHEKRWGNSLSWLCDCYLRLRHANNGSYWD
jgi:hypothetical protein